MWLTDGEQPNNVYLVSGYLIFRYFVHGSANTGLSASIKESI